MVMFLDYSESESEFVMRKGKFIVKNMKTRKKIRQKAMFSFNSFQYLNIENKNSKNSQLYQTSSFGIPS